MTKPSYWNLLRKVHQSEEGAVSLETILIIGAIALPILIFLIKVGWPTIKSYFNQGLTDLQTGAMRPRAAARRRETPTPIMLATILLLGLVLAATVTDLARHKIYNWTTYAGILAALGLSAAGRCWRPRRASASGSFRSSAKSPSPRAWSGLAACGLVMLVCFVFFRIGGGDVKLIAMLGAFLGWQQGITAMLWTFVLGACMGVIVLIWRVGPVRMIVLVVRRMARFSQGFLGCNSGRPLTDEERGRLQPPLFLAPSALAAVLIVKFSLMDWLMWTGTCWGGSRCGGSVLPPPGSAPNRGGSTTATPTVRSS